jgi:hypothetical protein
MLPVLLSLVAEPITGLVDTAFIARLGAAPLAALGVGTMALSSIFWIFNFLGIGTQTEISFALGRQDQSQAARMGSLSFATDGIHWGTGDFRYLKNVVVLATGCGVIALQLLDLSRAGNFSRIWLIIAFWILIRGILGVLRIWPGIGKAPLRRNIKQKDLTK